MWSKSWCVQQEIFLMSDQHIEIITLHVYWWPAVSPNKDTYANSIKITLNRLNYLTAT